MSQGESTGVGSSYSAVLVERANLSNPRNRGPEREGSGALSSTPTVMTSQRNTGRV
jgi:hypothetical protein